MPHVGLFTHRFVHPASHQKASVLSISPAPSLASPRWRVLILSTVAFTLMFNVWLMLGVLGIPIRKGLELSDSQLEWLIAVAILSGALLRLNFGIWADRFGGRNMMVFLLLSSAIPTYLFSLSDSYMELFMCAALFGMSGNSFSVGIAWNSAWFPPQTKGTALGVFGAGNVGAAGTKLLVLFVPCLRYQSCLCGKALVWSLGTLFL